MAQISLSACVIFAFIAFILISTKFAEHKWHNRTQSGSLKSAFTERHERATHGEVLL